MSKDSSRPDLEARVAELERQIAELRSLVDRPKISEDTVRMISAVVAAHLGKSARVKVITRAAVASTEWRIQGRAAIQGSHHLPSRN